MKKLFYLFLLSFNLLSADSHVITLNPISTCIQKDSEIYLVFFDKNKSETAKFVDPECSQIIISPEEADYMYLLDQKTGARSCTLSVKTSKFNYHFTDSIFAFYESYN